MTPTELWLQVTGLLRGLAPADRIGIAAALLVFALLILGRVFADWLAYRRRHSQRRRLERIRQGYTLDAPRREQGRRAGSEAIERRGVLGRAEVPTSLPGRARYAVTRRIAAAGGRRAGRLTAAAAGIGGLGAAVVLAPLLGWSLAGPVAVLVALMAGAWMLRSLTRRRTDAFFQEFPEAIDMLVRAVRAGLPVSQAIESAASELTGPVAEEFQRISDELTIGTDFPTALANAAARVDLREFDFFVVTLALQRQTGGRLTEVLDNLSAIIRGRSDMQAKVRALTADGRASSNVIAALPVAATGGLFVFNPEYISRFVEDPAGRIMGTVAVSLIVVGMIVVRRMANVDVRA
jgi:Flp pilus assembly protein TadB